MHLASKMELPEKGGGRAAIVLSGSPLFNGGAGSGESEIRRWFLENDLVEAIVALPTEIFFRTGIGTYLWILSNKKPDHRKGKVQLLDATSYWTSIKNEGNKRRVISDAQREEILKLYADAQDGEYSRMVDYRTFGYRRIKVLRPLRMRLHFDEDGPAKLRQEKSWGKLSPDQQSAWESLLIEMFGQVKHYGWVEGFAIEAKKAHPQIGTVSKTVIKSIVDSFGVRDPEGEEVRNSKGEIIPDSELTDYENVPLFQDVHENLDLEVMPHVPDAYIDLDYRDEKDHEIGRVGYEINFNRFFYKYIPPRDLEEIDADLKQVEAEIAALLGEVTE